MMPTQPRKTLAAVLAVVALAPAHGALASTRRPPPRSYDSIVARVASMVHDREAVALARRHGLSVLNVMWEDTGRFQGSSVGPNISDVTIEVEDKGASGTRRTLMPVFRFPNFSDKTADLKLDKLFLRVGNEREGRKARTISLHEFLAKPQRYLSLPNKGRIKGGTLLAERDTHALVSAQAAFLPVPQSGKATFYPVIFNYQSTKKNPAVLTLLVTRQGTSATIVDNARDTVTGGASWGQRLFFNKQGQRAPLIAERLQDVKASGKTQNGEDAASLGEDSNLLMLVQIPLKHKAPRRMGLFASGVGGMALESAPSAVLQKSADMGRRRAPDMDVAVLGHGQAEGPYTELDELTIERDPRFPVRVTVQFYQATSSANLGAANVEKLAKQIGAVYEKGDYVGSLVTPSPADRRRPTNWDGVGPAPKGTTWRDFAGLVERVMKYKLMYLGTPWVL